MAFVRSPLKTGSGPAPVLTIPNYVVEYEMVDPSTATDTFTVSTDGLYFLVVISSAGGSPTITINSVDAQIWNTNSNGWSKYMFVTLHKNDTVTFTGGGLSYRGTMYQAIRIVDASFNDLVVFDSKENVSDFTYDITNIEQSAFIYHGSTTSGAAHSDTSEINSDVCNTSLRVSSDTQAISRIVTSCATDNGGTINEYMYNYAKYVFVVAYVNVSPSMPPDFEVEHKITDPTVGTSTFTVTNTGLYCLIAGTCFQGGSPNISVQSDSGEIFSQGTIYNTKYTFAQLYAGDVVTFTKGTTSYRGSHAYAIRIKDSEYVSMDTATGIANVNGTTTYNIISDSNKKFILVYGLCSGNNTSDTSDIDQTMCKTYYNKSSDGQSLIRIASCGSNVSDGGTINVYSNNYPERGTIVANVT